MAKTTRAPGQLDLSDVLPSQIIGTLIEIPLANLPDKPGLEPDAELKASVKRLGKVLSPITVQVDGPLLNPLSGFASSDRMTVIDGNRRLKAARAAGLETIPAMVYQMDGSSAAITLMMNAVRSDNPLHELASIESMIRFGADEKLIANATGMPVATIRKRLKLQALILPLRLGVDQGKIAVSVAERAATLPPALQAQLSATYAKNGKLTAHDVADVKRVRKSDAAELLPASMFDFGSFDEMAFGTPNGSESRLAQSIIELLDDWGTMDVDEVLDTVRSLCTEVLGG
jgi:ParB-like chromosome segregation protein Spo0J